MNQAIFLTGSLLFLLFQAWRGWKKGIIRQGLSLLALGLALAVAYWGYNLCGPLIGSLFKISEMFAGGVVGLSAGLIVYFCIRIFAAILFKDTGQQSSGIIRFFYGLGGAACGILAGLILLWGGYSFVCGTGGIQSKQGSLVSQGNSSPHFEKLPPPMESLRNILDARTNTPFLSTRTPGSVYETFHKINEITSNQRAMTRFLQYPGVRKIMETAAVSHLLNNPKIAEATSRRDITALLLNPKLYQTMKDPEVERAIKNVDLEKALDYALKEPTSPRKP